MGKQSEKEQEVGAGQVTRGGVHYGQIVAEGARGGCRARHTRRGTEPHEQGYTMGKQSEEEKGRHRCVASGTKVAGREGGLQGQWMPRDWPSSGH